ALAESCPTPGHYACGNQFGAPPPDGTLYVCSVLKEWKFSADCGAPTACVQEDTTRAHCD
ncbi:putative fluoride ion transporter CrcB 1, partial [Cercophora samala]